MNKRISPQRKPQRSRSGAATVEFACCLPVLLAFIFGIFEFSRATQLNQSARLAAFEGARAGIALDAQSSDVTTAVNRVMSAMSISNFTTTITPSPLTYNSSTISVTVSMDPTKNAWFTWFLTSSNTISANMTLMREVDSISSP